jgi:hypothetical protein
MRPSLQRGQECAREEELVVRASFGMVPDEDSFQVKGDLKRTTYLNISKGGRHDGF